MRLQDRRRRFRLLLRRNAKSARDKVLTPMEGVCETAVANEVEHFMVCEDWGQSYDRRSLGDVLYHVEPGHKPHALS